MKKAIRVIIPLMLIFAILACTAWYLFIYDQAFTRDVLLYGARRFDKAGNHTISAWFYDLAYNNAGDNSSIAIELAQQHIQDGNYTKAEYTLSKAIADGATKELYIELCKTYVAQDKLMDAANLLNNIASVDIKESIEAIRPDAPTCSPDPTTSGSYYTQYITVSIESDEGSLYVNRNGEFPSVQTDAYQGPITLTDGENDIYAVSVADNGLVSPVSIFGFTVGGVITEVNFVDSAVEAAIRQTLSVSDDKVLYTDNLWDITEFTVPADAQQLDDLQHMVFLNKLTIDGFSGNQFQFLSMLAGLTELQIENTSVPADVLPIIGNLPKLQKLTLNNCSLSTVSGLEKAVNLTCLNLNNNTIRNIDPISQLTQLQELHMAHNALNDLGSLSGLNALTKLDISYNTVPTLSPICTIPGLKWLSAAHNKISQLSGCQQLTQLEHLDLAHNSIENISPLAQCSELSLLNISNNMVTDISMLSNLNKLANFDFSTNQVVELPIWDKDCALVNIYGSHNLLKTLEPLSGLKHLNNVYMDYNPEIKSVTELSNCPVLIQVNVFGTKVTDVTALTQQSIVVNFDPTL